ncbi:hypothetical protein TorRG33x02_221220 [Trema orientale]|uniref:Uncharacterized protein n=1 Tax=Trema orientale TaxID=63057 RepID=A0A2P5E990_TREOI|nr:hypothetical protein TorRG33x02_221220 [Trema orientale]
MALCAWNSRGVSKDPTANALRSIVKEECGKRRMDKLRKVMGFESSCTVEAIGRPEGLCLFWCGQVLLPSYAWQLLDDMCESKSSV